MQLEPIRRQVDDGTFPLGGFARNLVLSLIRAQPDLEERMIWLGIAQADGHLTEEQARLMAAEWGQ